MCVCCFPFLILLFICFCQLNTCDFAVLTSERKDKELHKSPSFCSLRLRAFLWIRYRFYLPAESAPGGPNAEQHLSVLSAERNSIHELTKRFELCYPTANQASVNLNDPNEIVGSAHEMANETAAKSLDEVDPKTTVPTNEEEKEDLDDWEMNAKFEKLDVQEVNLDGERESPNEINFDDEEEASPRRTKKSPEPMIVDDSKPRKDHYNIVFIGHVDAGKSTIGGQVLYLTGQVDKRTLEKYEREAKDKNRESWYLSWALDTNQEERDKGKTVEVGRGYFETENKHWTLLDAPGKWRAWPTRPYNFCRSLSCADLFLSLSLSLSLSFSAS